MMHKMIETRRILVISCMLMVPFFFAACAGKKVKHNEEAPKLEEAAPLDSSLDSSDAFSDLKKDLDDQPADKADKGVKVTEENKSGHPYYDAVGGETLGRVSYAIYGSKKKISLIKELNSELANIDKLTAGQNVYFDFDNAIPKMKFITKGMLERYPDELAKKIKMQREAEGATNQEVKVEVGDTLQKIAQRAYGSHRYWTELYILNHDKLKGFDKIFPGASLSYYTTIKNELAAAPGTIEPQTEPKLPTEVKAPVKEKLNISPVPVEEAPPVATQPVAPAVTTPEPVTTQPPVQTPPPQQINPTPPAPAAPPAQASATPTVNIANNVAANNEEAAWWATTNARRVLYLIAILLVVGVAFLLTKPSKKRNYDIINLDQLDGGAPKPPKSGDDRYSILDNQETNEKLG